MTSSDGMPLNIAFIGFGEAAMAFAEGWRPLQNLKIKVYDRLFEDRAEREHKLSQCRALGVQSADSAAQAVAGAPIVISAVTADQSLNAAEQVAPRLGPGQYYLDINSVAPSKKRRAAQLIEASGAHFLDVAVMSPVHPKLHRTPLLISAPAAHQAMELLGTLDLNFQINGNQVGQASTNKMLRSILIKGMESLLTECVTAAEKVGIADQILASAAKTLHMDDLHGLADYMMERVVVHGQRRAAEMREVAQTLEELDVSNHMASATAQHQQLITDLAIKQRFREVPRDRHVLAKAILQSLESRDTAGLTRS
ncbi:DUF1932 domain-containing protein [Pseudomonas sp. BN102]|uniref:NAD(P)-dependent oxidoreductase n=1 Tax=Pseudomonas sp. BN102 TaxID=2567886 RepID=UPI002458F3FA|nr:DUF1932 domain-containing protein [Pseudomonas sp. BN102]MDH4611560.1 NAD(P)-dependent oxidoreductase [Pseudomonas sp. BN102]